MVESLGDVVREAAGIRQGRPALQFRTRAFTYLELEALVSRTAAGLERLGVVAGDRVALYLHNIPAFVFAYYGALRLGAIVVPINITYQSDDLLPILDDCEARVLITIGPRYERIAPIRASLPDLQHIVVLPGPDGLPPADTIAWEELIGDVFTPNEDYTVGPDDAALISYGRSGIARGVVLSHANLLSAAEQIAALPLDFAPSDKIVLPLPLFNIFAMTAGLNATLRAGATLVLLERFEAQTTLDAVQHYEGTGIIGTPSMYQALVAALDPKQHQTDHLRFALSSTAALPPPLVTEFARRTNTVPVWQCYGQTESSGVLTSTAVTRTNTPGSVGAALDGIEIRLVDERGKDVPPGAEGELICRGPNIFRFYLNDEAATRQSIRGDWLHTGDLARQDAQGVYYITGRV